MGWKLLLFAGIFSATLWWFGYGPAELRRTAWNASNGNAAAIAPAEGGTAGDWGEST